LFAWDLTFAEFGIFGKVFYNRLLFNGLVHSFEEAGRRSREVITNRAKWPSLNLSGVDTLFDLGENPAFDRAGLSARLRNLSAHGIYVGGSSWKYEGWLDALAGGRIRHFSTRLCWNKLFSNRDCQAPFAQASYLRTGESWFGGANQIKARHGSARRGLVTLGSVGFG